VLSVFVNALPEVAAPAARQIRAGSSSQVLIVITGGTPVFRVTARAALTGLLPNDTILGTAGSSAQEFVLDIQTRAGVQGSTVIVAQVEDAVGMTAYAYFPLTVTSDAAAPSSSTGSSPSGSSSSGDFLSAAKSDHQASVASLAGSLLTSLAFWG
jgi:hypothetical protein